MGFKNTFNALFSKGKAYSYYTLEPLNQFVTLIKSINTTNVEEKTLAAETLFLEANWDVRNHLIFENISFISFIENWESLASESFLPKLLLGSLYTSKGWEIRGGDYIDAVSDTQWLGFEDYLTKAHEKINESLLMNPDLSEAYVLLLTIYIGLGDSEMQWDAYHNAIQLTPENLFAHNDMLWGQTPRWNCNANASLNDTEHFMLKAIETLSTPCKYYLWFSFIEECLEELEKDDYEDFINSETIRNQTNETISKFEFDTTLSVFNFQYANMVLKIAYELELEHPKLPEIAALVLPNTIFVNIWDDYADTPKEAAKCIKKVLKWNKHWL